MALFKRKQQSTTQIPELQDYYATQKKESTAMAWLLAIGSLVLTIVVFAGLFMGGRWLYRTMTKKDEPTSTSQTETKPADNGSSSTGQSNPNNSATINSGTVTAPGTSTTTGSGSSSASTTAPGVSPNQSGSANNSATAANTSLPNSGPGGVVVVFVLTTIAGTTMYRRVLLKKN